MRQRPDSFRHELRAAFCERNMQARHSITGEGEKKLIIFNSLTLQSYKLLDFYTLLWLTSLGYIKPLDRMLPLFSSFTQEAHEVYTVQHSYIPYHMMIRVKKNQSNFFSTFIFNYIQWKALEKFAKLMKNILAVMREFLSR